MLKRLFRYLGPLWEGGDQKPSYRRFAVFVCLWLVGHGVLSGAVYSEFGIYVLAILLVFILLMAGIVTWQQLKETLGGFNPFTKNKGGSE